MAGEGAMPRDVDIEVRVLQMEGAAVEPLPKGQEKDVRRRPVRKIPRQIPEPRLPLAQRQDKARHRPCHVRPICPQMLQIRRDKVGIQALRLQGAGRGQEDVPEPGDGIA